MVRDPRNVVTSLANHANMSIEDSTDTLINIHKFGNIFNDRKGDQTRVYMGTWSGNYNSWKSFKNQGRYLIVKYEDLVNDKDFIFRKILKFLHKLQGIKFQIHQNKFKNTIETTSFDKMKNLEKEMGFFEAKINLKTGKKIQFFNLGPKNDWKKTLDEKIRQKIEETFKKEMVELGYL